MQNTIRTENGTQADQIIRMSRTKPNKNFGVIWNRIGRRHRRWLPHPKGENIHNLVWVMPAKKIKNLRESGVKSKL